MAAPAPECLFHNWVMYTGLRESFEHCSACGLKRSEYKLVILDKELQDLAAWLPVGSFDTFELPRGINKGLK